MSTRHTMFVFLFIFAGLLTGIASISTNNAYVLVELDTSWKIFCPLLQQFRTDVSEITGIATNLIAVRNGNINCDNNKMADAAVDAFVYVLENGGKVNLKATLEMRDKLKQVKQIGNFKVRYIEAKNVPLQDFSFSNETIFIIIGIVLIIYLIGYFLILGVQSYSSTDTSSRPLSFVLAAENQYFVDGARRHKSTQYNLSKIQASTLRTHLDKSTYSLRTTK